MNNKPQAAILSSNDVVLNNVKGLEIASLFELNICQTIPELYQCIKLSVPRLIIIDSKIFEDCGWCQLQRLTCAFNNIVFVIVSTDCSPQWIFEAGKAGAYKYVDLSKLQKDGLDVFHAILEMIKTKQGTEQSETVNKAIIDDSYGVTTGVMQGVIESLVRIAPSKANVLIQGESGTGKEVLVNLIHSMSLQSKKAFVAVNCAAIPENLIESELFGHVKGAFTGAAYDKKGLFEEAHQGTLFLDEIGDLNLQLQAKLLRVLQDQKVRPVGSTKSSQVEVRLISATNKNLHEMILDGSFREDLFYRLNVLPLRLPPLRERIEDIPDLVKMFLQKFSEKSRIPKTITGKGLSLLMSYTWPGNIRELENMIERVCVLSIDSEVPTSLLQEYLYPLNSTARLSKSRLERPTLKEVEEKYIQTILEENNFQKEIAAKILGISRRTLYRKEFHPNAKEVAAGPSSSEEDILPLFDTK